MTPDERKVVLQLTLDAFRDIGYQAAAKPRSSPNGTPFTGTYLITLNNKKAHRVFTLSMMDEPPGVMIFYERTGFVNQVAISDPAFKLRVVQAYADISLRYFGEDLSRTCKRHMTKYFVSFLQETASLKVTDSVLLTRFIEGMADGTWTKNFVASIKPKKHSK